VVRSSSGALPMRRGIGQGFTSGLTDELPSLGRALTKLPTLLPVLDLSPIDH
jgi:hypothetical protein